MNFNEKLRNSMDEKGPEAVKKSTKILEEAAHSFNAEEYKKVEKEVMDFHENRKLNRSDEMLNGKLGVGKMSKGGLNNKPEGERPLTPPAQGSKFSYDNMVNKIVMWRTELERQDAHIGINSVFDSICVYIGEQQREIQRLKK